MLRRCVMPLVALALASGGCVSTSLHALSEGADFVTEPRMFGNWVGVSPPAGNGTLFDDTYWEPDGDWTIEAASHQSFRATQRDGATTAAYAGSVVRIGSHLFLDLVSDSAASAKCKVFPSVPVHAFFRVQSDGDTMIVGCLRPNWLTSAVVDGRLPARTGLAITEEDEALLTGGTSELQTLVVLATADPRAYSIGRLLRVH